MINFSSLCNSCIQKGCCTNSSEPLVFDNELKTLSAALPNKGNFLKKISIRGKDATVIKKKENSPSCIFWDEDKHNCSIYDNRPFDCRAYPFDILEINGKYHWIVYSCNPDSNWKWAENHLTSLENDPRFSEVINHLDVFSGNTERILPVESNKTLYVVLREIRIPNF